ncbi:MAG: thioredoxin domain-containing protein [Chloroflexi bacterium]|jgi:protein-disulfide isomerase/cyclophilin family peptidyl-prolyl cis-trans isomerase|nr:thioredoxin domain-containing protein [Chloroflexota bacterium]
MRKYLTAFLMIALLFIAACSSGNADSNATDATQPTGDTAAEAATTEATAAPFTTVDEPCQPFNLIDDVLLSPVDEKVPAVTDADLAYGPADAKYTIITYSNFTCSHCANLEPVLETLQQLYPQDVRIVFRYVTTGGVSNIAAQAAEAANNQGKFGEMKDTLFANQATWYYYSEDEFRTWLGDQATAFGMDVDQFNTDMNDENLLNKITFNRSQVDDLGITGTPTLYVNNRQYSPYQDRSIYTLATMINVMNISDKELGVCPAVDTNFTTDLQAIISTDKGDIVVDLYEDTAPYTVAYFKYLADQGWYDNNEFFVSTDEYALSGDPSNTLYGGPGFVFYNEFTSGQTLDEGGLLVSFNRLGTGYNSGVFMLTKTAVTDFSGDLTVFGKIIDGMDVLNALETRDYSLDPADPFYDSVNSVTIVEK